MAQATTNKATLTPISGEMKILAFPVKASETIYAHRYAGIDANGLLVDLNAGNRSTVKQVVLPMAGLVNDAVAGSISGTMEQGDRVILCVVGGEIEWDMFSGLSQANVGDDVYISTNNDLNCAGTGRKIGILTKYVGSATKAYFELINQFSVTANIKWFSATGTLTAAAAAAGIELLANAEVPAGKQAFIYGMILKVNGADAWVDAGATIVTISDKAAAPVVLVTAAKAQLTGQALLLLHSTGITLATNVSLGTGATAAKGLTVEGDANFGAGSNIVVTVFGVIK